MECDKMEREPLGTWELKSIVRGTGEDRDQSKYKKPFPNFII